MPSTLPKIRRYSYLVIFLITCCYFPCDAFSAGKKRIGFSQCTMADEWRKTQYRLMQIELGFYPDLELILKDAAENNETQIRQIGEFLAEGIDLLIVSPNESAPITPAVEKVYKAGIPVIVIDRHINSENYSAYIGGDNYGIGLEAGRYAAKLLKGRGRILEITGLKGSSPAIERSRGFGDVLDHYAGITIVKSVSGDWRWDAARKATEEIIRSGLEFDLVFAHNDIMANEAHRVIHENKSREGRFILGIDGLYGDNCGIQFVINKQLTATFLYPTCGENAIETAHRILSGELFPRQTVLPTMVIDSNNAMLLKVQSDHIEQLQRKIEKQKSVLAIQISVNRQQRFAVFLLVALLLLIAGIVVIIVRAYMIKKKNEVELARARSEADKANLAKSEFISRMSHELRTPMNSILGFAQLLDMSDLKPNQKKGVLQILKSGRHLLDLINEVLDIARIEAGRMSLSIQSLPVALFINETIDILQQMAGEKNIKLEFQQSETQDMLVNADRQRLRQVLLNLIHNAIKYNKPEGSIIIKAKRTRLDDFGIETIRIYITDTGIGISKENQAKIFNPFERIGAEKTQIEGAGIGLAVVKKLVEAMGGQIGVDSIPGEGSTFWVDLPESIGKPDQPAKTEHKNQNLTVASPQAKKILCMVSDSSDEELIGQILVSQRSHISLITAPDYTDPVSLVKEHKPDLVLIDFNLHGKKIENDLKALKSDSASKHIPVIVITSEAMPHQNEKLIHLGALDYLVKPINVGDFLDRIDACLDS